MHADGRGARVRKGSEFEYLLRRRGALYRQCPIANLDDSFDAAESLAQASSDDLDAVRAVMPAGTTQNPVKIADDGSAEVIDIYAGTDWDAHRGDVAPLAASSCVGSALMPVPRCAGCVGSHSVQFLCEPSQ